MVIEVKKLKKEIKNNVVFDDVNMKFVDGKIYGLIGRNGTGKSVFLKVLCNFYSPTSGEVLFDNINVYKQKNFPPSTRALIEKPNFLDDISGLENLQLLASIQKIITDEDINKSLDLVNIGEDRYKKYKHYSLGTKQKLGIAQVIMENPNVMIFDEPFNGIEEKTVKKLKKILKEYAREGKIIIISSHIKEDIEELCDVVYKFEDGVVKKI